MEAIAENPQQNTADHKLKLLPINKETAAEYGKLGAKARLAKNIATRKALNEAQAQLERLKPLADAALTAQAVGLAITPDEEYRLKRLIRTREQLEMLDRQLDGETDPKHVKSLADAIARLSEVERNLAGRPLPGSRRPGREKPARTGATGGPIDAE